MRRTSARASAPCHYTSAPPLPLSNCNKDVLQFRGGGKQLCGSPLGAGVTCESRATSLIKRSFAPHLTKQLEDERAPIAPNLIKQLEDARAQREEAELALRAQLEKNKRAEKALEEQTKRMERAKRALNQAMLIRDLKVLGVGVQLPSGCAFSPACRSRI